MSDETRTLLVQGEKTFKITIPMNARVTFAPFSPPSKDHGYGGRSDRAVGTLRIYRGVGEGRKEDNCMACFSGVTGFRDLSLGYAEEVAREEGATIWKSDENGYEREEKFQRSRDWVEPLVLEAEVAPAKKRRS